MKRFLLIFLAFIMLFSLTACGNNSSESAEVSDSEETETTSNEIIVQPNECIEISDDIAITVLGYYAETWYNHDVRMIGSCIFPEDYSGLIEVFAKVENIGQSDICMCNFGKGRDNANSTSNILSDFYYIRDNIKSSMLGHFYTSSFDNYASENDFLVPGGTAYVGLFVEQTIPNDGIAGLEASYMSLTIDGTDYVFPLENATYAPYDEIFTSN